MHHALAIPEIVAGILRAESSTPGFLHTCLLVNKTLSRESTRILWEGCGARYNANHPVPEIYILASIVAKSGSQRAQYYADFIHSLEFGRSSDLSDPHTALRYSSLISHLVQFAKDGLYDRYIDEIYWHPYLTHLEFPKLNLFGVYETDLGVKLSEGKLVLHYAQPKVEYFTLREGRNLEDDFLDTLSRNCPNLKSLTLANIQGSNVSHEALLRFLDRTSNLTVLDVRSGLQDSWSENTFLAVAALPKLNLLSISDIPGDWISSLGSSASLSAPFRELRHLYTGLSDSALTSLASHTPKLRTLSLHLQDLPPSHHILASASSLTHLKALTVNFSAESSINADDLLLLASSCPHLTELSIGESDPAPSGENSINDKIIDAFARQLPNIRELTLVFSQPSLLSWNSALSFGSHCKALEMLKLSLDINWGGDYIPEAHFPALWAIELVLPEEYEDERTGEVDLQRETERWLELAPKLSSFSISGGDEVDEGIDAAVSEACMNR